MIACDVNVLVYAHNADEPRHGDYREWLEQVADGDQPFGAEWNSADRGFARFPGLRCRHPLDPATAR